MKIVYVTLAILLFGGLVFIRNARAPQESIVSTSSPIDTFAQCLSDAGVKFYGTFWCPHCVAQKKIFNNSKMLPYVECSTPNGQAQTKVCADAGITSYPTWVFSDGSRLDGEQTFATLAEKTGCAEPQL